MINVSWAGIRENRVKAAGFIPLVFQDHAASDLAKLGASHCSWDLKIIYFQHAGEQNLEDGL